MPHDRELITIRPSTGWRIPDWHEFARYHGLFVMLIKREVTTKYRQTVLGPLWFVLQPVLTSAAIYIAFSRVARVGTAGIPPFLFYLCGLLLWNYTTTTLAAVTSSLLTNANLFTKVYFPRIIVPFATAIANLIPMALQGVVLVVTYAAMVISSTDGLGPDGWLLLPKVLWSVTTTVLVATGLGLVLCSLTAKYRDVIHLVSFVLQVGLFLTPVGYPASAAPSTIRTVMWLNPMASTIETMRSASFDTRMPPAWTVASASITAIVLAVGGIASFARAERTFVDLL